jgi:hypothetical protein
LVGFVVSIAVPDWKTWFYIVFIAAGTEQQEKAFRFALPIIGVKDWVELLVGEEQRK